MSLRHLHVITVSNSQVNHELVLKIVNPFEISKYHGT